VFACVCINTYLTCVNTFQNCHVSGSFQGDDTSSVCDTVNASWVAVMSTVLHTSSRFSSACKWYVCVCVHVYNVSRTNLLLVFVCVYARA